MQVTHRGGGPQYDTVEYFPHFHFQTGYALADENYDLLTEYWGSQNVDSLGDIGAESDLIGELAEEGAVGALYEYMD